MMIQTHAMLEDYGSGNQRGGVVMGGTPPHHQQHRYHHQHLQQPHQHRQHNTGVYMKPVYNLSSLCHKGPLTPPEKISSNMPCTTPPSSSAHAHPQHPYHSTQLVGVGPPPGGPSLPLSPCNGGGGVPMTIPQSSPSPYHHPIHHHHLHHHRPLHSNSVLPAKKVIRGEQAELVRCKRRVDLSHKLGYRTHPTAVARRNERERNRVKHINSTFATLRQHIPCAAKNKKMSKVETLRSAIRYINHLTHIVEAQKAEEEESQDDKTSSRLGCHDKTSSVSRLDCHERSSSVLLSPPGSPASCHGASGSAGSDFSPSGRYAYDPGLPDDDDDVDDDVDGDACDDVEDESNLTQFADWFS